MIRPTAALGAGILAAFVAPAEAAPPKDDAMIGTWEIVSGQPAPWTEPAQHKALSADAARMTKLTITFGPKSLSSRSKLFTCSRVVYEALALDSDALFQGNLPEPNPTGAAKRLGFPRSDVPSMDVTCPNATFVFHFLDGHTAMTALDNVIYTLKLR
jgi:hypothetical protein